MTPEKPEKNEKLDVDITQKKSDEPQLQNPQAQQAGAAPTGGGQQQPESQQPPKPKRARGLAAADPETRRQVARKGGEAVSKNKKHMAEIGKKGGEAVSQDRKHMAAIGRKGGEAVSQNREHMAEIGRKGGEARGTRLPESTERETGESGSGNESESG